jgi:hypothetical protein
MIMSAAAVLALSACGQPAAPPAATSPATTVSATLAPSAVPSPSPAIPVVPSASPVSASPASASPASSPSPSAATQESITEEQARTIALAAVPGTITEVRTNTESGRTFYKVTITPATGAGETDVKVATDNGEVIEIS